MSWSDIGLAILSIYGAGLSTYLFVLPRLKHRPGIAVKVGMGYLNQGSRLSEPMLILAASNKGDRPVTVTSAGLKLPQRGPFAFLKPDGDITLPHILAPGKSCRVWIPASRISKVLKEGGFPSKTRVVAFYTDEMERLYAGNGYLFDRDAYERGLIDQHAAATSDVSLSSMAPATIGGGSGGFKW